ncbi:hypothetical protein SO694_0001918 [Aureococcus anophagefferens]|uniref:Uncharacterized protein n=1 Tax=Aureococcus anophagefferens TaxID=44056 RepID=A0ABR1FZV3_AURAN
MDDDDDDLFGDVPAVRRPAKKPKPSTSLLDSFMVADAKKASRLESLRLQNAASREKVASISESKEPCCEPGGGAAAPQIDWDYIRRGASAAPAAAKKLVDGSDDEDGVGGALDDEVYEAVIGAALPAHLGSPDEATAAKLLAQARFELSRDAGAARECKDSNAVALAEYGLLEAFAQLAARTDDSARRRRTLASPRRRRRDARLVEALEEAYGAHYVTTQRGLGAAAGLRKLDVGAALIRWLQLLVAFGATRRRRRGDAGQARGGPRRGDAAAADAGRRHARAAPLRESAARPRRSSGRRGAGSVDARRQRAPAPRRLARCLGVWAACVDAGAAALDAPALAALGKVCARVVAPDAAVHDCSGCARPRGTSRARRSSPRRTSTASATCSRRRWSKTRRRSPPGDAAARYVVALNALPCPADGRFVAAHVAAATGALVGLGALDDAGVPPPARVAAALHKCETSKTAESPCLGAHETFYAALACCASLFSQLAPTLAPPDRALIEDAAQALKRKLRNEMDPMAARNIELLDALLTDLKLDTTKKVSKQTTLDFAAK